jgi:hypothetical protein
MSSSRNTTSRNTAAVAATPFCKVCRDAGKSEKEYTSHFVKNQPGPEGKVICPTLLSQTCRICHNYGHTSSYCPEYNNRRRNEDHRYIEREQPRRNEDRYIEREQPRRNEDRYIEREQQPRRNEDRYIEREQPRRNEDRYIEREQPRRNEERYIEREQQPRRHEERRYSYNMLHEDTERAEREIRDRDDEYYRQQDRQSKPWLQAALKRREPEEQQQRRREPYAHPHGPRVRLNLESTALCASKHAVGAANEEPQPLLPAVDVRKVQLNHASNWGDEDVKQPFVCDPEQMTREFLQNVMMSSDFLTSSAEYDFIAECDDQDQMPFSCGY